MRGRWAGALEVAHATAPAAEWRAELARRLRTAADGSFAAVMTCAPGDWSRLNHDADPIDLGRLVEQIQRDFIPRIERAGEDWRFAMRTHGPIYAPIETARSRTLACELREEVLRPAGIDGYLTALFTIDDPLRIVGMAVIGSGDGCGALTRRAVAPLREVVRAASHTLGSALALAEGCFAHPGDAARLEELTARERQVASLSAQGFSNLAVAARLGISEATIAVHLRKIYAKLSVHSRVELAAAVGPPR
jgi:DNA-binding CsgD family transcriptional regulator